MTKIIRTIGIAKEIATTDYIELYACDGDLYSVTLTDALQCDIDLTAEIDSLGLFARLTGNPPSTLIVDDNSGHYKGQNLPEYGRELALYYKTHSLEPWGKIGGCFLPFNDPGEWTTFNLQPYFRLNKLAKNNRIGVKIESLSGVIELRIWGTITETYSTVDTIGLNE